MINEPKAELAMAQGTLGGSPPETARRIIPSGDFAARPHATLDALLQEAVTSSADPVAVIESAGELKLSEVLRRANLISERLSAAGVMRGTVVALDAHRGAEAIIAALGIVKCGAVCLPLEATSEKDARSLLRRGDAELVLSRDIFHQAWREYPARHLDASGDARIETPRDTSRSAGWLLFTSGSTGEPKGVLVPEKVVVARLEREPVPWAHDEKGCHRTGLRFIDSLWEMFAPLAHGCPTVIADRTTSTDPVALAGLVEATGITRLVLVPSMLSMILKMPARELSRLVGVRLWISTGDHLTGDIAQRLYAEFPQTTLINIYGTTECWDACWTTVGREAESGSTVSIGRPMPGVKVWLVDDDLRPSESGASGELIVSGPLLADGYINNAERSSERFLAGPADGADEPIRAYRTGDIARRQQDGSFDLIGRRDLRVKIRGHFVDIEELERRLAAFPGIHRAGVVPMQDRHGVVDSLTAYVECDGSDFDARKLRAQLSEQVADHCMPRSIRVLEKLPLLPSGKLDRQRLSAIPYTDGHTKGSGGSRIGDVPSNDLERAIAAIWQSLLETTEPIGIHDSFFAVGGNSLLAIALVMNIQERFDVNIPLQALLETPTIAALSEMLDEQAENQRAESGSR